MHTHTNPKIGNERNIVKNIDTKDLLADTIAKNMVNISRHNGQ